MKKRLLILSMVIYSQLSFADWSMSVASNNPPGASVGLNFMYLWTNWAFEFGFGQANSSTSSSNTTTVSSSGDINFKYLFGSGWFRPYLQGGTGVGVSVGSGASAGTGSTFGGAGIFMLGQPIYAYLSYVTTGTANMQFGVGYRF